MAKEETYRTKEETYRDALLMERYEDIIFELDSNLIIPANGFRQKKEDRKSVV